MNNEYEILLNYLNKNSSSTSSKEVKIIEEGQKNIDPPQLSNKKEVLPQVKEIVDSGIGGFDVNLFEKLMQKRLIENHQKMQTYERPNISVTELFSCLRQVYYARLKYQINLEKKYNFKYLHLIQSVANNIHECVQDLYPFDEVEKPIISEIYKVKGRVDAINQNCVVELKTLDENKFKPPYIKEHYFQGIIYAYILNTEFNYHIEQVTLVYFFRDKIKKQPIVKNLPTDEKLAKQFLQNANLLHKCIISKEVPNPINATNDSCTWCEFKEYCIKDNSEIKRPFETTNKEEKPIDLFFEEKDNKKSVFLL